MDDIKFAALTPIRVGSPASQSNTLFDADHRTVPTLGAIGPDPTPRSDRSLNTEANPPMLPKSTVTTPAENSTPESENPDKAKPIQHIEGPDGWAAAVKAEPHVPRVLTLALEYGEIDVPTKLILAQVSSGVRRLAIHESQWSPVLDELDVPQRQEDTSSLLDLTSPTNILSAGYNGSAYTTFMRILRVLGPLVRHPEGVPSGIGPAEEAAALVNARKIARIMHLSQDALEIHEVACRARLLDTVRQKLQGRDASVAASIRSYITVWDNADDLIDLCIETNPGMAIDPVEDAGMALSPLAAGLDRLTKDAIAFPEPQRLTLLQKGYNIAAELIEHYINPAEVSNSSEAVDSLENADKQDNDGDDESGKEQEQQRNEEEKEEKQYKALQDFCKDIPSELGAQIDRITIQPLVSRFLEKQLVQFQKRAHHDVLTWNESVNAQETANERFIWSGVPKSSDKKNFLDSFRRLVGAQNEPEETPTPVGSAQTKFEAQTQVLIAKLRSIDSLVSLELCLNIIDRCRRALHTARTMGAQPRYQEQLFVALLDVVGTEHIQHAFEKAITTLNAYDPKKYGRLVVKEDNDAAIEPLGIFAELVNIGDLVQQLVHVFFEEELVIPRAVRRSDFAAPSVNAKRKFEQMLDDELAEGLSRGIDVLMDQIDFVLQTEQLGSDFCPPPGMEAAIGPTAAAESVVDLVRSLLDLLRGSIEKNLFDVFQQEVGLRLYHSLMRHIKRQSVSIDGAITLLSDINFYYGFVASLRQQTLLPYYEALKQIGQLYLIDTTDARQLGLAVSDLTRFKGVVSTDELMELLRRRQDWPLVRGKVEKVLYGITECCVM